MNNKALENLLILLGNRDEAEKKSLANLSPEEWEALIEEAMKQEVLPLLYHYLKELDISIPKELEEKVKQAFLKTALRNSILYEETQRILRVFNRKGIPLLLLKGIYLAMVYENIGLRPMGDIDILIQEKHIREAHNILLSLGWKNTHNCKLLGAQGVRALHYNLPGKGIFLDLQWELLGWHLPFKGAEEIWTRAKEIKLGDVKALVLSPDDLLIHLCLHTAIHTSLGISLRMLCDINELIKRQGKEMNWEAISARAKKWGVIRPVYLILRITSQLFATDISPMWLSSIEPSDFDKCYIELAIEQLGAQDRHLKMPHSFLSRVRHSRGWRKRISLFRRVLFPPREIISAIYGIPLSSPRIYIFYIVRWISRGLWLLRDYCRILLNLTRRDKKAKEVLHHSNISAQLYNWLMGD